MAGGGPFQKHTGNEQAIDLVCTFEDPVHSGIPVVTLDRILGAIAIASVNLHGLIHNEVENLTAEDFQD